MNLEQLLSLVRTLLASGGPIAGLLTIYGFPQDKASLWLGLALAIVPPAVSLVWGIVSKTDRALVVAASNVAGTTVQVNPLAAPQPVIDAAKDPAVKNVEIKPST